MANAAMQPGADRRAGEGAGLVFERRLGGGDRAVLLGADLDLDCARPRSGRWRGTPPRGVITIFTGRPALLRQRERHRLEIDQRLAAEAAADLRRGHADVGDVDPQQLRDSRSRTMNWPWLQLQSSRLAVARCGGDAGMRLDIALVHRLGGVFAARRSPRPPRSPAATSPMREDELLGDVRGLGRRGLDALV